MTTGQERLIRTAIDILGENEVLELLMQRIATALDAGELNTDQRISLLRSLVPGLNEQELRNLLDQGTLLPPAQKDADQIQPNQSKKTT